MIYLLYYIIYSVSSLFSLWVFYLAVMHLVTTRDRLGSLNKPSTFFGTLLLILAYIIDFNANVGVMTLLCLELPKETTVTARMKRYKKQNSGWRRMVADFIESLTDPFDPSGNHI